MQLQPTSPKPIATERTHLAKAEITLSEGHTTHPPTVAQPFDEIRLSDTALDGKVRELYDKGHFSIEMTPTTREFLESKHASDVGWKNGDTWIYNDLSNTEIERNATRTAERIVEKLEGRRVRLKPGNFEVRRVFLGADRWHRDTGSKKLVCLTTLRGGNTQFIEPDKVPHVFGDYIMDGVKPGANIEPHVQETATGHLHFFAASGVEHTGVPILVHRAPAEFDRSIFMGRWQPDTAKPV